MSEPELLSRRDGRGDGGAGTVVYSRTVYRVVYQAGVYREDYLGLGTHHPRRAGILGYTTRGEQESWLFQLAQKEGFLVIQARGRGGVKVESGLGRRRN